MKDQLLTTKFEVLSTMAKNTIEKINSETILNEVKECVNNKFDPLLDLFTTHEISFMQIAFEGHRNRVEIMQELVNENETKVVENTVLNKIQKFRNKIKNSIEAINSVINKYDFLEHAVEFIQQPTNKLFRINSSNFELIGIEKLKMKVYEGKEKLAVKWEKNSQSTYQDSPHNTSISINIKDATSTNQFIIDKTISTESVIINLSVYVNTKNQSFGIYNEKYNSANSNLAHNPKNAWLFNSQGQLSNNSVTSQCQELKFDESKETIISLRINGTKKQCYFKVNNNHEQGPIQMVGETFYVFACYFNEKITGKVKILNSFIL